MNNPTPRDGTRNDSSMARRVARYGPLLVWIVFISIASTREFSAENTSRFIRPILLWLFPNVSEPNLDFIHFLTRKAAHLCEYAVLAFLARRAFISSSKLLIRRHWFAFSLVLVVLNSLLDELHQAFVPARTGSIYDSAIDVLGGLTVLTLFKFYGNAARADDTKH